MTTEPNINLELSGY